MAHGHPDYGIATPTKTIYPILDIGELAARLGSIVTFDRRGNVIFLEDFEGSLSKLHTDTQGTGGSISISNKKARHGDFSCKMITGDATDDYAFVEAHLAYPTLSKIGVEISWCLYSNLNDILLGSWLYDGTHFWLASVDWAQATKTWAYLDADGNWIDLSPAVDYRAGYTQFNQVKLVADFKTKEYVRLIANNLSWDLSGKALRSNESVLNAQLVAAVDIYTEVDESCIAYLDSIIVTQNEP